MYEKKQFESTIAPIAGELVGVIKAAFANYLAEQNQRSNPSTEAQIVNDYMHEGVKSLRNSLEPVNEPGRYAPLYRYGDLLLQFKKLKKSKPSGIRTRRRSLIEGQQMMYFYPKTQFESLSPLFGSNIGSGTESGNSNPRAVITVGYELDPTRSEINAITAVLWENGRIKWKCDLECLASTGGAQLEELALDQEPPSPTFSPKEQDGKRRRLSGEGF